jgi:osomolarity two-component system sensor histidine kinase SLN1
MVLWGDTHRILQVVINLVSNSLKFTPVGGSVVLKIRCLPELPDVGSRRSSMQSRNSKRSRQRSSKHQGSEATLATPRTPRRDASHVPLKERPFAQFVERAPSPPPGKYLSFEFEVQDSGPGIPEHLQQQIFEPFVQGDLGLSKKYGGTGLGLSICSQLAGLMRGDMSVKSAVGEGSTFTMKIPLRLTQSRADSNASSHIDLHELGRRAAAVDESGDRTSARHSRHIADDSLADNSKLHPPEPSGAVTPTRSVDSKPRLVGLSQPFFAVTQPLESPGSQPAAMEQITAQASDAQQNSSSSARIRVLVAEDNKTNQEVVLRMLKLEEIYDVTVARDGQEALDLVRESMLPSNNAEPYNLVLMDVQMPTMDGLQSTRLIREIGYRAPIVALTAFSEESNIRDCLDSGMDFFLSKPIRRPMLKKVLKEYCAPIAEEEEECGAAAGGERKKSAGGGLGGGGKDGAVDGNGKPIPVAVGKFGAKVGEERAVSPLSKV